MFNLETKAKHDNLVMKALKVSEIRHLITGTDKGELYLMLRKGGTSKDYFFALDSVPVDRDVNKDLFNVFDGVIFSK